MKPDTLTKFTLLESVQSFTTESELFHTCLFFFFNQIRTFPSAPSEVSSCVFSMLWGGQVVASSRVLMQ